MTTRTGSEPRLYKQMLSAVEKTWTTPRTCSRPLSPRGTQGETGPSRPSPSPRRSPSDWGSCWCEDKHPGCLVVALSPADNYQRSCTNLNVKKQIQAGHDLLHWLNNSHINHKSLPLQMYLNSYGQKDGKFVCLFV